MWWEQCEDLWEDYQLKQILMPAVHQKMPVIAPAAGELIQIQCYGRVDDFGPYHHDSPSVWFTTELFMLFVS